MSSNNNTLPFLMDYLPEEFFLAARQELNETPEKKVYYLQDLKVKIKGDNTLSIIDFQEDFLLQFLRVSKFNILKAFSRLQKYTHFRRKHPNFFLGVQEKISINSSYRWMSPLPYRNTKGCAILLTKFGMWNTSDISYEHLQGISLLVIHQALRNPLNQINGFQLILDFKNTTLRHLRYGTPGNMLQIAQTYLETIPLRFKQFHCVNCTMVMKLAWTVISPFMPEKAKSRVIFHKHPEDLLNHFPKHTLPVEYGGELEDYYMYEWMKEANYQMEMSTPSGQKNLF